MSGGMHIEITHDVVECPTCGAILIDGKVVVSSSGHRCGHSRTKREARINQRHRGFKIPWWQHNPNK